MIPVILSGGSGTRLWPASRESYPKQLLPLTGDHSLLQETAARLPRERLLIETDAPFLAPVPHRGKPCEPAFVADTARFLASLRGEDVDDLAAYTAANFCRLFAKAV